MVKHIVMWTIQDNVDGKSKSQLIQELKSKLEALPEMIPEILDYEVGINFNPGESAYDVSLYSEFEDKATLKKYQKHPEHVKVAEFVGSIRDKGVVVDYEV